MLTRGITRLFMVMICLTLFTKLKSQTLQVTANFVQPDIPVTIHPENPAYCNPNVGVEVMVVENFNSYLWISPTIPGQTTSPPPLIGKNAVLKKSGEWRLRVEYEVNGVVCIKEIKFYVGDLSNSNGIEAYFENAGFYSVSIFRENPTLVSVPECNPDLVTFVSGENYIDLNEAIQNVYNNFKPISEVTLSSIVLSENNCLCNVGIDMLENQFNEGSLSVWGHQFFKNSSDLDGKLFVKARMPGEERLPIQTQKEHLQEIHPTILSSNVGSQEHGRVIFSNMFMPHPIGGYEPEGMCEIPNNLPTPTHLLTPAKIAVQLETDFTNIHFAKEDTGDEIIEGAFIKFSKQGISYQGYLKIGADIRFNGYYHDLTATFYESFTAIPVQVACRGECKINITTTEKGCSNNSCRFLTAEYTNEEFEEGPVSTGGFNFQINGCEDGNWVHYPINFKESRDFIYHLMCSLKNEEEIFSYNPEYNNTIIFAKNIYVGKAYFPYVGVTMPNSGNSLNLLKNNEVKFNVNGEIDGFKESYIISQDLSVRLAFLDLGTYTFNDEACKIILRPSYPKNIWNPEIVSCLSSSINENEFNNFINPPNKDNLLIFVNGYRARDPINDKHWWEEGIFEYRPKSNNDNTEPTEEAINYCNDNKEAGTYWNSTGTKFINKINNQNVLYVDGHNSISTSNHKNMLKFGISFKSCVNIPYVQCATCILNSTPNFEGFIIRYNLGKKAGELIWNQIRQGKIKIKKDLGGKIYGKIDIVAHSMGYAYAKGIADYLAEKDEDGNNLRLSPQNTLGYFYVIAPENAIGKQGSTEQEFVLNPNNFQGVWQYGSNFVEELKCHQDGVAPQVRINGLGEGLNVFIPMKKLKNPDTDKLEDIRRFSKAHSIDNFYWLFTEPLSIGRIRKRNN